MPNTFSPRFPATTDQFVGFVVVWFLSTPFLWLRPEKFKAPFLVVCIWCGAGMLAWMIWAVATAKGVGLLWNAGQTIPSDSPWGTSWIIMAGINQTIGGLAAGGFSWRAIPSWLCGWAPTIGGLVVTVRGDVDPSRSLVQLYNMAFLIGFFTSAFVFYILNLIFPVPDMDQVDPTDLYGTFTETEARRAGVAPLDDTPIQGVTYGRPGLRPEF